VVRSKLHELQTTSYDGDCSRIHGIQQILTQVDYGEEAEKRCTKLMTSKGTGVVYFFYRIKKGT
jgi:hypothetical protein